MSKTALIVASVTVIALSSSASYYIAGTQRAVIDNQVAALQENVQALQKQLETARQDLTGLRNGLADRKDDSTSLREQVAQLDKRLLKMQEDQDQMEDAAGDGDIDIDVVMDDVVNKFQNGKDAEPGQAAGQDGEAKPETNGQTEAIDRKEMNAKNALMMSEIQNALKETLKNENVQVKGLTLPNGGVGVMLQGPGMMKVKRFNPMDDKKAEPPPKVPEQF